MMHEREVMIEACIDADLRERAEGILAQLGISVSAAITYYYLQIALQKGIPFLLKLPSQTDFEARRVSCPDAGQSESSYSHQLCS